MDVVEFCRTFQPKDLSFSLLVVSAKPSFVSWVSQFKAKKGLAKYNIYFPEEDSVWMVPSIHAFSRPGMMAEFLRQIKPRMLLSELYRFGATAADLQRPITAEIFDEFFDVFLRNEAVPVTELLKKDMLAEADVRSKS